MNLFDPIVPEARRHPIFRMLMDSSNGPERAVLDSWADGFGDRDGKFVQEFQTTFESSFWELYVHAALRAYGMSLDWSHVAPDFVVTGPCPISIEATIAAPPLGGSPAFGPGPAQVPDDLNVYNAGAMLRICNGLDAKVRRYRNGYGAMPHVAGKPFAVALAPYDRPLSHLAANRPILAALYGYYFDEEASIASKADHIVQYPIDSVTKNSGATVPVGLFASSAYREIAAVLYSPLATWGKVRALADAPDAPMVFQTLHPPHKGLVPQIRTARKRDYSEHLLDGLYVFHNPYADHPIPTSVFEHPRVAQFVPDANGDLHEKAPDDFLLLRQVWRLTTKEKAAVLRESHR